MGLYMKFYIKRGKKIKRQILYLCYQRFRQLELSIKSLLCNHNGNEVVCSYSGNTEAHKILEGTVDKDETYK